MTALEAKPKVKPQRRVTVLPQVGDTIYDPKTGQPVGGIKSVGGYTSGGVWTVTDEHGKALEVVRDQWRGRWIGRPRTASRLSVASRNLVAGELLLVARLLKCQ